MIADYCAGAGGKTLAAGDADARHRPHLCDGRFGASGWRRSRRARRAPGVTNVHALVLGEDDARARRLAGKLDRVLVDAPCSGFGTLRRNPDLKWRHRSAGRSSSSQRSSAASSRAAARLVKPGGRLVYATCSILQRGERRDRGRFQRRASRIRRRFRAPSCSLRSASRSTPASSLRLWPHRHGTDGFLPRLSSAAVARNNCTHDVSEDCFYRGLRKVPRTRPGHSRRMARRLQ